MEECRTLLNGWFGRITQHRAVLFSHAFRSFIDVAEHVPTARNATLLSPQCIPQQQSFPVTCVHYDPLSELVFITSGQPLVSAVARLVMPNKVRGAVTVYPAGAQADQQGIPHIAQQLFSTGAVCVTYSPELHCLYVGLADGSILFYHFIQSKPSTLTYVTEISCHSFPISAMICHHARHRHIAASLGGTLSVFDTGKGEIVSQVILGRGTAFTSVAYYAAMNWCFCGTSAGALIVYDVTGNPAKQLCELRPSSEVAAAAVMCIFLQEDLHQLYLAVGNEVVIYNLPYTAGALPQAKVWKKLSLSVPLNITSMNVLMNGQYIAVTCQSVRSVTVFDLTSKDAPPSSNNNKKAGAKAQHEYDSLSTASEKLAPWTEVLTQSNAEIRIWLQGHGVNAVGAVNRAALLRMLKNCAKISDEQLAEKLRTVNPNGTILLSALVLGGGTPPPAITSTFYVQHKQQIVVGGSNGAVVVLSLTDFLPLPNADEIQQLQDARHSLPHSGAGNASAIKNTGGAVTRGRRLQVEG